ncbi:MAG: protein archease [Candidatus Woesearchaeota archaeon]|nr:protein archease [Candidatus Woesearchaeota archaeon]
MEMQNKKDFEFLNLTTSDLGFKAYGKTIEALFINSAKALFSIICDINMVPKNKSIEFSISGNPEELLYDWLTHLLMLSDSEELFFSDFKVSLKRKNKDKDWKRDEYVLKARCIGDSANQAYSRTEVKAITMFNFQLKKTKDGFEAIVVVDV